MSEGSSWTDWKKISASLSKETLYIRALDLGVLMYHFSKFSHKYGHLDAEKTEYQALKEYNRKLEIPLENLERMLYASNMLGEENQFWHPFGLTFKQFLSKISTSKWDFNSLYNLIEKGKVTYEDRTKSRIGSSFDSGGGSGGASEQTGTNGNDGDLPG